MMIQRAEKLKSRKVKLYVSKVTHKKLVDNQKPHSYGRYILQISSLIIKLWFISRHCQYVRAY